MPTLNAVIDAIIDSTVHATMDQNGPEWGSEELACQAEPPGQKFETGAPGH